MTQTPKTHLKFLLKVKDQLNNFYRTLALKHHRTFLKAGLYVIETSLGVFFFFFNLVVKILLPKSWQLKRECPPLFFFQLLMHIRDIVFIVSSWKISPILCLKNDYFSGRLHLTCNFRKYTLKRVVHYSAVVKKKNPKLFSTKKFALTLDTDMLIDYYLFLFEMTF